MSWMSDFHNTEGNLQFKILEPAQHLRKQVAFYWILKCNIDVPLVEEYLAPDGFEEIIFSYGGPYRRQCCGENDEHFNETLSSSYIVGAKNTGLLCSRENTLNMIGVKLYPQSLYQIFGYSLDQHFNQTLSLKDLNDIGFRELEERLYDAASELDISKILDRAISNIVVDDIAHAKSQSHQRINYATKKIFRHNGMLSIDSLIADLGCHYRTLEKSFIQQVGQTPKSFARNIRFKHALHAFSQTIDRNTPFSVYDFGYYDQSHFAKEFRAYTGTTSTQFVKNSGKISTQVFDISHSHSA